MSTLFKIAAIQMNARVHDIAGNLELHRKFFVQAADAGCDLVVFPELSVTAHFGAPDVLDDAEGLDGNICREMQELARRYKLICSFGMCERAKGTFFNSQVLMGPKGLLGVQRKTHPSGDEYLYFGRGNELHVVDAGLAHLGTLVCYDSTFPETWRVLGLKGADIILMPHASRSGRGTELPREKQLENLRALLDSMPREQAAHCKANAVFAVFCNQWGYNGHSTHEGGAWILSPRGRILARGDEALGDTMIVAEIDLADAEQARRSSHCTLRTRRPEIYGVITELQ